MIDNLKKPCGECPFRRDSVPGWLGGLTPQVTNDFVLAEANFACHRTRHKEESKMSRCKGSILFLINHCKSPKINEPLRRAMNKAEKEGHDLGKILDFDFIKYHSTKLNKLSLKK